MCKTRNFQINEEDSNEGQINGGVSSSKRGKRSISVRNVDSWRDDCRALLDQIMTHADSVPFREPVNLRDYPVSKHYI